MISLKKIISVIICTVLVFSLFAFNATITFAEKGNSEIIISDFSGNPKDTVYVPVIIDNNTGFSDIALSVNFDKSALDYEKTIDGLLNNHSVFNHLKDGRIAIAYTGDYDIEDNGILFTVQFKIKKNAKIKKSSITLSKIYIKNISGKSVSHSSKNGSIDVQEACSGEHDYLDWQPVVQNNCTKSGIRARRCKKCGGTQNDIVSATGHEVEDKFTVDIVAKNGKPGIISRHCVKCNAKTNIVTYTENNATALSLNDILDTVDNESLKNLIYFLNGSVTYPDVYYEIKDVEKFIANYKSGSYEGSKSVFGSNGTINVDAASDKLLRKLFGNGRQIGIFGVIKRAAIADEIPIKLFSKLFCLLFI